MNFKSSMLLFLDHSVETLAINFDVEVQLVLSESYFPATLYLRNIHAS